MPLPVSLFPFLPLMFLDPPSSPRRFVLGRFPTLSRLHYHSYQFHMIAQLGGVSTWGSGASSVAAGSVATTLQACGVADESKLHGNQLDLPAPLKIDTTEPSLAVPRLALDSVVKVRVKSPVAIWSWPLGFEDTVTFYYAPVLVCKAPVGTVGLGDAISASGLAAHLPK